MIKSYTLRLSLEDEMELNTDNTSLAEELRSIKVTVDVNTGVLISLGDYLLSSNHSLMLDGRDKVVKGF